MSPAELRKLIETSNHHMVVLQQEGVIRDGLTAESLADTKVGDRVRKYSRGAEDRLLEEIAEMAQALKSHNRELQRAVRNAALIEEAQISMEHRDSYHAMDSPLHEAQASVVELSNLRMAVLAQISMLSQKLATIDGRSVWTDVPSDGLFPAGPGLRPEPDKDAMDSMVNSVNQTRAAAARQGEPSLADEELNGIF